MSKLKVISDSSCDLSKDYIEKYDISIIPYRVTLDGENYFRENIEMTVDEFYKRLRSEDVLPKTSLPPIQDYIDVFKENIEKGYEIMCVNLTTKFSGSFQSAFNAKNILLEDYPDAKIHIMDSKLATGGQGGLVIEICRMRDAGMSVEEIVEKSNLIKDRARMYCTVDTLKYLQKGGRIGKASAFAGSLLNIKPIIVVKDGELIPHAKVRGRKKTIQEMIRIVDKDISQNREDYSLFVLSGDELEESMEIKKQLEEMGYTIAFPIMDIGVTIGAHIGPTTIGIGYINKFETV